jgi:hypothetical protein
VNNREYQTDAYYPTEYLAKENAAMRAYLICRNFSVNDGKYPVGHDHGGIVQGIPTAIGTGRHSHRHNGSDTSSSPGSSPGRHGNPRSSGYAAPSISQGSSGHYGAAAATGLCTRPAVVEADYTEFSQGFLWHTSLLLDFSERLAY